MKPRTLMKPRTFPVTISAADWWYLMHGDKNFIVIQEPYPGLHYGDTLRMKCHDREDILERWVRYAESGIHLLPDSAVIELGTGESPLGAVQLEEREMDSNRD